MAFKLAVIISGNGSNLQALIDACHNKNYPARIAIVISDNPSAYGIKRAKVAGLKAIIIDRQKYSDDGAFEKEITSVIRTVKADLICLAGFMRLFSPNFVTQWKNQIINIHPSLLPAFKGLDVHARVLNTGTKFSGCTVHFVRPRADDGPIILQAAVPILPNDDVSTLSKRILKQEHIIYPKAVRWIAENRIHLEKDRVVLENSREDPTPIINPSD